MARTKSVGKQSNLFNIEDALHTAPCVPAIRLAVDGWREGGYKGVTATTQELLNFWFYTDHIMPNGRQFRYHRAQREAIETLIFLYEVAKVRSRKGLLKPGTTRKARMMTTRRAKAHLKMCDGLQFSKLQYIFVPCC